MIHYLQDIVNNPLGSVIIVLNLIVIESLLSVDNAAVLATMVLDLPKEQRQKALRYGILGAYIFRGICLLLAAYLIKIWWLKALGGLYLLYLAINFFVKKGSESDEDVKKEKNWLYKLTYGWMGQFWATVVLVEIMDLAFSLDNVFAVIAFTDNIVLVWIGVFIGILAMRFVAQAFVKLMEKYPGLETAAFVVIGILGIKLVLSIFEHFYPETKFAHVIGSHYAEWGITALTLVVFFFPLVVGLFSNKKEIS